MNPTDEWDLIDIREHLKFQNNLTQAKGFSNLCKLLKRSDLNQKFQSDAKNVFFDCLFEYGNIPFDLFFEAIVLLEKLERITKSDVWENYIQRFPRILNVQRAFTEVVTFCRPSYKDAINIATKIDNQVLLKAFSEEPFKNSQLRYLVAFFFAGVFRETEALRLLGDNDRLRSVFLDYFPNMCSLGKQYDFDTEHYLKSCMNSTGLQHPLKELDKFKKLKLMYERPNLAQNKNIGEHVIYVPYLFLLSQYRQTFFEELDSTSTDSHSIRQKIPACCTEAASQLTVPSFKKDKVNLETYVAYLVEKQTIGDFISFVENYKDSLTMFHQPHVMAILPLLLLKAREHYLQERIVDLICYYCQKVPERAHEYSLYFMSLIIKPFFDISYEIPLKALKKLAVNKFVLPSIVSFLLTVLRKEKFAVISLNSLSDLAKKYPMIIGEIAITVQFVAPNDIHSIFSAKLNLAKECCIATDENDDVLSLISSMLKGEGDRLGETIDAVSELVKNDVLELRTVRKQLTKRMSKEKNEKVLSAYCRLLSLGTKREDDVSDEEFNEFKASLIRELYEIASSGPNFAGGEAWSALGDFEIADIEETLVHPKNLVMKYSGLHEDRQHGFVEFVRKMIGKEVESYQRPLYTTALETLDVPPLLAKVDNFKENLLTNNKEETWFWSATLPLVGPILQLTSPSNKMTQALRIIKSCLLMVPESTSQEDMVRLVAGWRIAIREALNAITEAKGNDILWARDQICKEGKACLTEKKESVDNIMMMLTVLADVVEEKLRTIDSQQHVDEVSQAQKPWLISVFEFVATRLPKEVKQLREQKANPIYQMLTHSNKSSLFIAIFCTRLLFRNPSVLEFYGDGSELNLVQDRMFDSLLMCSNIMLRPEEVPDRKMMWIMEEAYGTDEVTANAFETMYLPILEQRILSVTELELENSENVEDFFTKIVQLSRDISLNVQKKNKKTLEKLWAEGTENVRKQIYEGLAEIALISGSARKRTFVPNDKLSDQSVLRAIITFYEGKCPVGKRALQMMLGAFVNHKRLDGKYLPPLNWSRILEMADWKSMEDRMPLVKLSCEQNISEVLFSIVESLDVETTLVISEHVQSVAKLLPRRQFEKLVIDIIMYARLDHNKEIAMKLAKSLASIQKNMIVRMVLSHALYKLDNTVEVTDVILSALNEPNEFGGLVSKPFDVWLEARNGEKMNIQRVCDVFNSETTLAKRVAMISLISLESRVLSMAQRYEKVLDVITASRITRSRNGEMSMFLPIILALVVSPCDEVDLPICGFGNEKEFPIMQVNSKRPFIRAFLEKIPSIEKLKPIVTFLHHYLVEEKNVYEEYQVDAAADILRTIAAMFPAFASTLSTESEEFWASLLPF